MVEEEIRDLKLFDTYNVVCFGNTILPFQFNDKRNLLGIRSSEGINIIVPYNSIERVEIITDYIQSSHTYTKTKKKGGITRAVVGGALFGGVGAIVGAATAGSKSTAKTTYYTQVNGHTLHVYLKNGSSYSYQSKITGFNDKTPPTPLREAEFYFNQIINRNKYPEPLNLNNDSELDYRPKIDDSILEHEVKKELIKKYVMIILLCLMAFISILSMLLGLKNLFNSFK